MGRAIRNFLKGLILNSLVHGLPLLPELLIASSRVDDKDDEESLVVASSVVDKDDEEEDKVKEVLFCRFRATMRSSNRDLLTVSLISAEE